MTMRGEAGFSFVEALVALVIFMAAIVPMLYVTSSGQRLARSQPEATDLHQRIRVAADKLRRDVTMAGAGPLAGAGGIGFGAYVAAIVPARTGLRLADAELSASADRLSVIYVPEGGRAVALAAAMPDISAPLRLDVSASGCAGPGLCGFSEGSRALLLDARDVGAGYEIFTVTSVSAATGEVAHDPPNPAFSRVYDAGAWLVPVVQHVYYFDRPGRRLMLYDGYQSDVPLVDNVVDLTFSYFVDGVTASGGLRQASAGLFEDGPPYGLTPNRFDADLLGIRLVRIKLRLQAAADDVRGRGVAFSHPGGSTSGYSYVPDYEVTFDVAPRNQGITGTARGEP